MPVPSVTREVEFHIGGRTVAVGRWEAQRWELLAVDEEPAPTRCVGYGERLSLRLPLRLYADESRHYRYNLESEVPVVFVVCTRDEAAGGLQPRLATLSQDEAASYMEADEEVLSHPLPEALCAWAAGFLGDHEAPAPVCGIGGRCGDEA